MKKLVSLFQLVLVLFMCLCVSTLFVTYFTLNFGFILLGSLLFVIFYNLIKLSYKELRAIN
jgi:hypothetical protein